MIKKIFLSLIFLASLAISVSSQTLNKVQGWAERGGKNVKTSSLVTHEVQESFPGATITVYLKNTTTIASIYSDDAGLVIKNNPFTIGADAYYSFYVNPGRYDIKIEATTNEGPQTLTLGDVTVPGDIASTITTITPGSSITINADSSRFQSLLLNTNVTSVTVDNASTGDILYLQITQDAIGNRTVVWPTTFPDKPVISGEANSTTIVTIYYDGSAWRRFAGNKAPPIPILTSSNAENIFNQFGNFSLFSDLNKALWYRGPSVWRALSSDYNAKDFNASGKFASTTGSMSVGGFVLTVADATTFKVNQGVRVVTAGSPDLYSVINSISGNNLTLRDAAASSVSGVLVEHDDTEAINVAIAASWEAGGGCTKLGSIDGNYYRVSKWNAATNSALAPPAAAATWPFSSSARSICIKGDFVSRTSDINPNDGVVLHSKNAGTGNFSAIFAVKPYTVDASFAGFANVMVEIENVYFRVPANPTIGAVQLTKSARAILKDVAIDSTNDFNSQVEPTNSNVAAITMPGPNNYAYAILENISVIGAFPECARVSEHLRMVGLVSFTRCKVALVQERGIHLATGDYISTHCPVVLKFDSAGGGTFPFSHVKYTINVERQQGGSLWYTAAAKEIDDSSGTGRGIIHYKATNLGVTTDVGTRLLEATDGSQVRIISTMFPDPMGAIARSSVVQSIPNNVSTTVTLNTADKNDFELFNSSLSTTRVTVKTRGWFLVSGTVSFAPNATGIRSLVLRHNNTTNFCAANGAASSDPSNSITVTCACPFYASHGDFFEMSAYQNSGGALNTVTQASFTPRLTVVEMR